jgi:hypothetical protein
MNDLPVGQKTPLIEAPKADAHSVFRRFIVRSAAHLGLGDKT